MGLFSRNIASSNSEDNILPSLPYHIISDKDAIAMAMLELEHFINKVLNNIEIESQVFNATLVYETKYEHLLGDAITAKKLLFNYLLYPEKTYYYYEITEVGIPDEYKYVLLDYDYIDQNNGNKNYKLIKTITQKGQCKKLAEQLIDAFKLLVHERNALMKGLELEPFLLFQLDGLTNVVGQNLASEKWLEVVKTQTRQTADEIITAIKTRKYAILSGEHNITVVSAKFDQSLINLDLIYGEISRILKKSQNELFGIPLNGLSNNSSSDIERGDRLDETMLKEVLVPVLEILDIRYTIFSQYNYDKMEQLLNILDRASSHNLTTLEQALKLELNKLFDTDDKIRRI